MVILFYCLTGININGVIFIKTLYVTDLDGTLLTPDIKISDFSRKALNSMLDSGENISIATGRSYATAKPFFDQLNLKVPIVLMNGVFIYDTVKHEFVHVNIIEQESAEKMLNVFEEEGRHPFFYTYENGEISAGFTELELEFHRKFYKDRANLSYKRFGKVDKLEIKPGTDAVYINYVNDRDILIPIYNKIKKIPGVSVVIYPDNYTKYWFLEAFSDKASKGYGVKYLKKITGAEKVVVFGDNRNDLEMFKEADEAFAVEGSSDEVKAAADGVVGSNSEDGVVRYLIQRTNIQIL